MKFTFGVSRPVNISTRKDLPSFVDISTQRHRNSLASKSPTSFSINTVSYVNNQTTAALNNPSFEIVFKIH